ncbi:hypothetical protein [Streptomyces sp. Y1]|uniref:Uncharacterized protein n=1 Tax=Streptomyces sp. Y1 TaxID=3238634 RepID=A0AB39TVS0_9ACTN
MASVASGASVRLSRAARRPAHHRPGRRRPAVGHSARYPAQAWNAL